MGRGAGGVRLWAGGERLTDKYFFIFNFQKNNQMKEKNVFSNFSFLFI
jgi:hypothetical protein